MADLPLGHDPQERAAYRYMDVFRLLAALAVVLNHARDLVWVDADKAGALALPIKAIYFLAGFGHEAVMIFFVLSGFWITHSAERLIAQERFWADYLIDRLSRLLVVIVPALLLGGLLDWAGAAIFDGAVYFGRLDAHSEVGDIYHSLTLTALAGNLLFLQDLAVPVFGSNAPLWSLSYEFWYYLWFAAAVWSLRRRRAALTLATFGVGVAWPQVAAVFPVWLLGSALYYADRWCLRGREVGPAVAAQIFVVGVALLAAALVATRLQLSSGYPADYAIGVAFVIALWGLLRGALPFPRRSLGGAPPTVPDRAFRSTRCTIPSSHSCSVLWDTGPGCCPVGNRWPALPAYV